MDTISKRLKDAVRNNMQTGRIYSNEDIRQLIYDGTGMKYKVEYRETHFAGCLSALKKSGEIIQVERGEYRKGTIKRQAWHNGMTGPEVPEFSGAGEERKERTEREVQKFPETMPDSKVSINQVKKDISGSVRRELLFLREATKNIVLSFNAPQEEIQYMLKLKELMGCMEEFERQTSE